MIRKSPGREGESRVGRGGGCEGEGGVGRGAGCEVRNDVHMQKREKTIIANG